MATTDNTQKLKHIAKRMSDKSNKYISPDMVNKVENFQVADVIESYVARVGTTAIFYEKLENGKEKVRFFHW